MKTERTDEKQLCDLAKKALAPTAAPPAPAVLAAIRAEAQRAAAATKFRNTLSRTLRAVTSVAACLALTAAALHYFAIFGNNGDYAGGVAESGAQDMPDNEYSRTLTLAALIVAIDDTDYTAETTADADDDLADTDDELLYAENTYEYLTDEYLGADFDALATGILAMQSSAWHYGARGGVR